MSKNERIVYFSLDNKESWKNIYIEFKKFLEGFKNSGKSFQIIIDYKKLNPTNRQRAYIFSVIIPMMIERLVDMGYNEYRDLDVEGKEQVIKHYLGFKTKVKDIVLYKSFSNGKGDKEEVKNFIDNCIIYSAENLDLVIPPPRIIGF